MGLFSFFDRATPSLVQTGPGGRSRAFSLDKDVMSIGRSPEADIVVDDPYVAPVHARVERQKDGAVVIRRTGLNPIFLQGEAILQTAALKAGDTFRLGQDVEFQFVVKTQKAAKPEVEKTKAGAAVATAERKPLLKRPAFLAAVGVIYLGLFGGVALFLMSGDEAESEAPSGARIKQEAAGIAECLASARRMRSVSEPSFNGAVGGRTVSLGGATSYATLAASPASGDETASAKAVAPIAAEYERTAVAALAAESRGDQATAQRLYQRAFDIVPDINCSAAQFAMERKAATRPAPVE